MIKCLKDRADTEPNNNLNLYFNKDESTFIDPDDQNVSECRPEKDRKTFLLCLSSFCILYSSQESVFFFRLFLSLNIFKTDLRLKMKLTEKMDYLLISSSSYFIAV